VRGLASDNWAGVHPEVLAAIARANDGHAAGYGHDELTERVERRIAALLGAPQAEVFLTFNGTGANVIGLQSALRPHHAVLCAEGAHIDADEGGAPERFIGAKLIPLPAAYGKLLPETIAARAAWGRGVEHHVQPRVVSISQSTELGTVYTPEEVRAIAAVAREHDLILHMDGARLANAVAALGVEPQAITIDAGVDILTFGATKNGALFGEAVVAINPELARDMLYIRKQAMQLASKMRFLAAQFDALLDDDLWLRSARHANAMAARLGEGLAGAPGIELVHPVQANAVFARIERGRIEPLQAIAPFYVWDEPTDVCRLMCAFDTEPDDVDAFVAAACAA
jgi:threonine aldolase